MTVKGYLMANKRLMLIDHNYLADYRFMALEM